jgi:hypothetical protein
MLNKISWYFYVCLSRHWSSYDTDVEYAGYWLWHVPRTCFRLTEPVPPETMLANR